MESYRQTPGADPESPSTVTVFTYPSEEQVDTVINALFPTR